ncbi:MAG: hypothetical protein MUF53_03790 [Gemmatimonadaceae bacterium]|nr:hypothetical protein [Gemmatimonadaceae bacterium]
MATHVEPAAASAARATARPYVQGGPRSPRGTVAQIFFEATARHRKADALLYKQDGAWKTISHEVIATRVRRIALGLQALGIAPGARVGLLSENRSTIRGPSRSSSAPRPRPRRSARCARRCRR